MLTADELAARRSVLAGAPELQRFVARLHERAKPVLDRPPVIPERKALLSMDGGICPDDHTALTFDPWSPEQHRCPRCGRAWAGERHDGSWTRYQHLWLSERAAQLATLAALDERHRATAAARAREILGAYAERYWRFPNRDNVLGPSRLFFSTYLESMWTGNMLAAAQLLRAAGLLDDAATRGVNQVAEEAATLIGDYDEAFSNRQTWNNAALTAVAVWFEDEDLARRAIEGPTGLLEHLMRGYGRDGMWYEGENYHLFALRGLLMGLGWARLAGVDLDADKRLTGRLGAALLAPALSALPDFTYPARKDARFGISLAQPAYLELWEIGLARLGGPDDLPAWLATLYGGATAQPMVLEYYLHDVGVAPPPAGEARSALSWWALLEMLPELPEPARPWSPTSVLLESQGLAILRAGDRYASVECGPYGGGHGHPDRLHLTVHAGGVHWLPDFGTGSYVAPDLFWYRSTLAHNAPQLDGVSQPPDNARCENFDVQEPWGWTRGRYRDMARTIVAGPAYLLDVVELSVREEHTLELPWHVAGTGDVRTRGRWLAAAIANPFVTRVERFVPDAAGAIVIEHGAERATLTWHTVFAGELLRAEGPGRPANGEAARASFYVVRARGRNLRIVSVLEATAGPAQVRAVRGTADAVEVETARGVDRHLFSGSEWTVQPAAGGTYVLRGARAFAPPFTPLLELDAPTPVVAPAFRVAAPPPLDGTFDGFDLAEPFQLSLEDQYRRSEDAYPGPEELSAVAYAAWDESSLYLAVDITKPELCFRAPDAPPLKLDNERDDIHSDGLQVYVMADAAGTEDGAAPAGYLVVPAPGGRVRAAATSDASDEAHPEALRGGWARTPAGYRVTIAMPWPSGIRPHAGARVRFDLIVNELLPGRLRRVGQLVWSGGGGWVWLRGDRQDPSRFGILELVV